MDVRVGDVLELKKQHPVEARNGSSCGLAWISKLRAARLRT